MDPADMSGGTGGGGGYPEWTKSQLMLLLFWNKLQEAYDAGESSLMLAVIRSGDDAGVRVWHPMTVSVSDELPELKRGGEAVAVFDRLWKQRYIDVGFGSNRPSAHNSRPVLHNILDKGLIDIGKFPDPDRRLAAALASAQRAIEREPSIPEPEKRDMLDTLDKMASLASNVRGLAQAMIQGLSNA